ncbi:MAG TPA: TylF/MycF/NovP-related O-methyltransferase, partial [Nitrospiraceae bacterium]|nr:TylF/MycF/NovP-related O-methyltransferase [Nitrospiraceae bacterium]
STPKGYFSVNGATPVIDDRRVTFFKGWFEDTLSTYRVPRHEVLFITLDADLYSSTKTVLGRLKEHIRQGTFLYFDEFSDRFHEMKAFDEFLQESGMTFRVIGADAQLSSVIFQRVG